MLKQILVVSALFGLGAIGCTVTSTESDGGAPPVTPDGGGGGTPTCATVGSTCLANEVCVEKTSGAVCEPAGASCTIDVPAGIDPKNVGITTIGTCACVSASASAGGCCEVVNAYLAAIKAGNASGPESQAWIACYGGCKTTEPATCK